MVNNTFVCGVTLISYDNTFDFTTLCFVYLVPFLPFLSPFLFFEQIMAPKNQQTIETMRIEQVFEFVSLFTEQNHVYWLSAYYLWVNYTSRIMCYH